MADVLFPYFRGLTWTLKKRAINPAVKSHESAGGKEARYRTGTRPKWGATLSYEFLRSSGMSMRGQYESIDQSPNLDRLINVDSMVDNEVAVMLGFFLSRGGSFRTFLFNDLTDCTVGLYRFADGDGATTSWSTGHIDSPLLFTDQSPFGLLGINSFVPAAGASIDAAGRATFTDAPIRGQPLYVASPYSGPTFSFFGEQFGIGDEITSAFQLTRIIGGTLTGFEESIQNLNGAPVLWDNGILVAPNLYSVSSLGLITFATPPLTGHILSWAGKFYHRLKFVNDEAEFEQFMQNFFSNRSIECRSVLL